MHKLNTAFVDCVFFSAWVLMGSLWTADDSVDSLKSRICRITFIIGCCWATMAMMPPLLMCACMTMVMVTCITSALVIANSHLTSSSVDSLDLDVCEDELTTNVATTLDAINSLPILKFSPTSHLSITLDSCCICITKYFDGVQLRQLKCGHTFHVACINEWLLLNPTCPLCKHDIRTSISME